MSGTADALVHLLAREPGKVFSLDELAVRLDTSVSDLRTVVGELTAAGFQLVYETADVVRLIDEPERVEARKIREGLRQGEFGWRTEWNWVVESTQEEAARLAREGAPAGTVVVAEAQTRGRGRGSHRWFSPLGGAWFSILAGPVTSATEASQMNLAAAVAVAEAVRLETGVAASIKWPNDITANGKKLGGILTELEPVNANSECAIVGIGINANVDPAHFPAWLRPRATSLLEVLGERVDRTALIRRVLHQVEAACGLLRQEGLGPIIAVWRALSDFLGRQVVVQGPHGREVVQAVDVDSDGALVVRTAEGIQRRHLAGEVELVC